MPKITDSDLTDAHAKAALVAGYRVEEVPLTAASLAELRKSVKEATKGQAHVVVATGQRLAPSDSITTTIVVGRVLGLASANTDGPTGPWSAQQLREQADEVDGFADSLRPRLQTLGDSFAAGIWLVPLGWAFGYVAFGTPATAEQASAMDRSFCKGQNEGECNEYGEEIIISQTPHINGVAGVLVANADVEHGEIPRVDLEAPLKLSAQPTDAYFLLGGYLG